MSSALNKVTPRADGIAGPSPSKSWRRSNDKCKCFNSEQTCQLPLQMPFGAKAELRRQLSPHELAHQEALIQEREAEIQEIETGIHELNEIFLDLGTLVVEQGSMLGE